MHGMRGPLRQATVPAGVSGGLHPAGPGARRDSRRTSAQISTSHCQQVTCGIPMKSRVLLLSLLLVALPAFAAEPKPPQAAVASAHPLATKAGMEILDEGGNAFDAAVAVGAALSVVEPYSSGIGGGGLWLLHRNSDGFETMIDGREYAPGAASADMYQDKSGEVIPRASMDGPLSTAIPGMPAALVYMAQKYGKLGLARDLAPAIKLARDGFPLDQRFHD